jgi:hypothetical protein
VLRSKLAQPPQPTLRVQLDAMLQEFLRWVMEQPESAAQAPE